MTSKLREWDLVSKENVGFHEAADIFPEMSDEEFAEFKQDIKRNGLLVPIVTTPSGHILDGRHRWRACMETGTEPRYQVHSGNPWAYVISANLHRRHLTSTQRGMVVARIANRPQGGDRRSENWADQSTKRDFETHLPPTLGEAATIMGIGRTTVTRGREILKKGIPELIKLADDGLVKAETGARIASLEPAAQKDFVDRVRNGERPRLIAPPSKRHMGGAGKTILKQTSVSLFTKLNAEALGSALFGIDTAFKTITKVDKAVTPDIAYRLVQQIRAAKSVLAKLNRLLESKAKENQ